MSEASGTSETTQGVSRRSIVKGAAWTAPVIAAAVAAPAAAASPRSATVQFDLPTTLSWTDWDGTKAARPGAGPTQFSIINTSGAIAAGITGTLVVEANTTPTSGQKAKGLGIQTLPGGTIISRSPATRSTAPGLKADTVTTSFSLTAGVASGATVNIPLTFGYQPSTGAQTPNTYTGTFTATLTLFSGTVQIGSSTQVTLSKN